MLVPRGVASLLAAVCLIAFSASLSGCNQNETNVTVESNNGAKNKGDEKPSGDSNGRKIDDGTSQTTAVGPSPLKTSGSKLAGSAAKGQKAATIDPPTIDKKESGSTTKRKLRGPRLGAGR